MLPRGSRPWQQSVAMWLSFVSLSSPWPAPGSSLILGQTYGRSPYLETNHPSLIILLNVHSPTPTQIYTIFVTFLFLCALMQFLCLNLVFKHEPIHGSLVHPRIQGINSQAVHLNKSLLHAVYTFECSSLLSYFNQRFCCIFSGMGTLGSHLSSHFRLLCFTPEAILWLLSRGSPSPVQVLPSCTNCPRVSLVSSLYGKLVRAQTSSWSISFTGPRIFQTTLKTFISCVFCHGDVNNEYAFPFNKYI